MVSFQVILSTRLDIFFFQKDFPAKSELPASSSNNKAIKYIV
jgi:hypothetical protein